ncbi:MAG: winged helix-turn-helix domain-containing protein [Gammaproteobacteria bacterium]|nr:winged helix-turn-helix domain-containing protein [Gammaproteobacteria bacterium]
MGRIGDAIGSRWKIMQPENLATFKLGAWYVEPALDCIRQGDLEIKLECKVMAILCYLAARPGEVVSRQALEQAIWADNVVGYDALTSCIAKLRKALNDDARQPHYIATLSKKGYRLLAPVEAVNTETSQLDIQQIPRKKFVLARSYLFALLVSLLLMGLEIFKSDTVSLDHRSLNESTFTQPSIVVLPFKNYSDHRLPTAMAQGFADDISNKLSAVGELTVITPSASRPFISETDTHLRTLATKLGVRYILNGSVHKGAMGTRVNASLIDGSSGFQLWSKHFELVEQDIFKVQQDIAEAIVTKLRPQLKQEEQKRLAQRYTNNLDAYRFFLLAQYEYLQHSAEANLRARDLWQQAIALDAGFARAYAAIALSYIDEYRYQWQPTGDEVFQTAMQYAEKALRLDSNLAQAHWVMANVYLFQKQLVSAKYYAQQAVQINASFADAFATLAIIHLYSFETEQAQFYMRRALQLNPLAPARYQSAMAQIYFYQEDYQSALNLLQDVMQQNANLLPAQIYLIANLVQLGNYDEADWEMQQLRLMSPSFSLSDLPNLFPFTKPMMQTKLESLLKRLLI